ncbi:LacI family DNA-binding transcriptional regulator [Christensenella minuta]|uniref:Putative HTH-type transcriptional repressor PurR n=1 Tax=Christensenella minuta TaxID=626937 RepID=A0A136Q5D7_9FIRM|nr:LacI family DNA-binding transcriptional regulator [Christensenella minuta]AYH40098.1 LacI family transcriptional regulator [Christensenella minuta]KXK65895.1 putative HTH-type transcriptional repressor PurR [Christensenella minuta]MDY3752405.1 LacI family DNA-binding transcriptional regulator [Christensenella minuta]
MITANDCRKRLQNLWGWETAGMVNSNTLKDIAKKLNVSVSTVSRAVNNKSYVKEETRQKVLQALKEYHYVPNEIARSLKSQSTKTIGVIIPDICEMFFGQIIKGIDEVVSPEGYTIIVSDSGESKTNEARDLEMLFQKRVDALVLATVELKGKKVLQFLDHDIPVVFIDNLPVIEQEIDAVMIDNVEASKIAMRHLIGLNHREIAVIIGSIEETTGYDRMLGYKSALREADIPVDERLIAYGNYKENKGYECMCALLDRIGEVPFTAVYVTSEMMTFGAIKAINDRGLRIPEDISLIGFDVHDKTGLVVPGITTVRQPESLIGTKTGELLIKRLKQKGNKKSRQTAKCRKILLDPYLEIKQSCRKK